MRRFAPLLAVVLLGSFALAACAEPVVSTPTQETKVNVVQSDEPQSAVQEEPDGLSEAQAKEYFEKLANENPQEGAEAAALAAPDSNAFAYATYLAATFQSYRDGGFKADKSTVNKIDDGFSLCPKDLNVDEPCSEYTHIQDVDGKIADFDTGGEPLAGRISLGSGEAKALGDIGEATLLASYKAISGNVVIVFDIRSMTEGLWVVATYVAPDGRQSETTMFSGPSQLTDGAFGTFMFVYEGADYGGSVLLEPFSEDSYDSPATSFAVQ